MSFRDTRAEYPPEYDLPDPSEWEGPRLRDICRVYGIEPAADCLRAIDRHGDCTVSVRLPNGQALYVPDDLTTIRALPADEPVAAWIVHGIAWDGSDWEYSEEVATEEVEAALVRFMDALAEHRMLSGDEEVEAPTPPGANSTRR